MYSRNSFVIKIISRQRQNSWLNILRVFLLPVALRDKVSPPRLERGEGEPRE